MPGSHPYAGQYPAKPECVAIYGIPKREKFTDDIRPPCQSKVQVWEPTLLVPGILCGYGRKKQGTNCRIYSATLQEDIMADQISFKEYIDPFTGSKTEKA